MEQFFDRGMHKIQAIYSCWGYFNKIETYNSEMTSINNNITESYKMPSFHNQTFYGIVGKPLTINDTNNIFKFFGGGSEDSFKDNNYKVYEKFTDYNESYFARLVINVSKDKLKYNINISSSKNGKINISANEVYYKDLIKLEIIRI